MLENRHVIASLPCKPKGAGFPCWCKPCEKKMAAVYEQGAAVKVAVAAKSPKPTDLRKSAKRVLQKRAKSFKKATEK